MDATSNQGRLAEKMPLCMALKFITDELGINDSQLERKYGLDRKTLRIIRREEMPSRGNDKYMRAFLEILHKRMTDYAYNAKHPEWADNIRKLTSDMLFASYYVS